MLVELVLLAIVRGRTMRLSSALAMLAAGACLLVALRGALTLAPWPFIAAALVGALVAHAADLFLRLRGPEGGRP
jgi:hypothetical protein